MTSPAEQVGSSVLSRLTLTDILDDAILAAQPHDKPFPLRLLLAGVVELAVSEGEDDREARETAWCLACALNVFFRVTMEEEVKLRLGLEVSRLYYAFVRERAMERDLTTQISPLLASLLSHELGRVRFESIDHLKVFDSAVHERDEGADSGSASIAHPNTFLCRVAATGVVRVRARVMT